jgi:hypothetical protein
MTSTDSTPASHIERVPGISALIWNRTLALVYFAAFIVFLIVFLTAIVIGFRQAPWFLWAAFSLLGIAAVATLLLFAGRPLETREVRAGYTTLPRKYPELPQLDPKTGIVVRNPGEPYLRSRSAAAAAQPISASEARRATRPSLGRRARGPILTALISFVVVGAILVLVSRDSLSRLSVVALAIGCLVVAYLIGFAIVSVISHGRAQRLRAAVGDDLAFRFMSTRAFKTAAAGAVAEQTAPVKGSYFGASANRTGLTIWHGNPPLRVFTLPWPMVTAIQRDSISSGNGSIPTILVTFRDPSGSLRGMQLGRPNADVLPLVSRPELDWLVSELTDLRVGNTTARVL